GGGRGLRAVAVVEVLGREAAALAVQERVGPGLFRPQGIFDLAHGEDFARAHFEEQSRRSAGPQGIDDDRHAGVPDREFAAGVAFDEVPGHGQSAATRAAVALVRMCATMSGPCSRLFSMKTTLLSSP